MHVPIDPAPDDDRIRDALLSVRAPGRLREHVAAERDRTLIRRLVVRRMKLTGVMAGAAAVLGVVVALVAPSSGTGGPSALDAAALAGRGATAPAPRASGANPEELSVSVGGVAFPSWGDRVGWTPSGRRADDLGGRATVTVFYDNPAGKRLVYTIVDGDPLPWPDGARTVVRNGVDVHVLSRGGRSMAFWRAGGRSCVISAPQSVGEQRLVTLATAIAYAA